MLAFFFILAAMGGYLLGSIPFGLVLTRAAGLGDVRAIGSGNIGATNVLRTGRKDLALATLLLDAGKAGAALSDHPRTCRRVAAENRTGIGGRRGRFCRPLLPGVAKLQGRQRRRYIFRRVVCRRVAARIAGGRHLARGCDHVRLFVACRALRGGDRAHRGFDGEFYLFANSLHRSLAALIFWRHRANIKRLRAGTEPRIGAGRAAQDCRLNLTPCQRAPAEPEPTGVAEAPASPEP